MHDVQETSLAMAPQRRLVGDRDLTHRLTRHCGSTRCPILAETRALARSIRTACVGRGRAGSHRAVGALQSGSPLFILIHRRRHERGRGGPECAPVLQDSLRGSASAAAGYAGATAAPASRRSVSTAGTTGRPARHHSNRALLGAMARECSRRRRTRRARRTGDVSTYGDVAPPRRGPRCGR